MAWAIVKKEMTNEPKSKTLVKEVVFGKGIARITSTMFQTEISLDGWKTGSFETHHTEKIEIVVNGKVVASGKVSILNYNDNYRIYNAANLDTTKKYTKVGDKAITEGDEAGKEIIKYLEEMEIELAREFGIKTEKEKEQEADRKEAQSIIAAAEKEGIDKLMTAAEIKKWRARYNNIHNEGGEGYIPRKTSREAYNWALSVLNN